MASWPGTIPQKPASGGMQGGPQNNQIAFEPEVGDSITRRRGSAVAYEYQCRFASLTLAQLETFETFYVTTLVDGTDTFTWTDPIHGDSSTWRIKGSYQIAEVGPDLYDLSLTMIRLPG